MNRHFRGLFLLVALSLSITGCAIMATQFSSSSYGIEMQSMVKICMNMQKNGLLPGIGSGKNKSIKFTSDEIDFSKRNDTTYPLRLNCIITQQNQKHYFPFVKHAKNSRWKLSK